MTTVEHVHHQESGDSSAALVLAILALAIVIAGALFIFRDSLFANPDRGNDLNINVETPTMPPTDPTPDTQY